VRFCSGVLCLGSADRGKLLINKRSKQYLKTTTKALYRRNSGQARSTTRTKNALMTSRLGFCRQSQRSLKRTRSQTQRRRVAAQAPRARRTPVDAANAAPRLRLVTLRRERSPRNNARVPPARLCVKRSPRTPRKAGDGGLTGSTPHLPHPLIPSPASAPRPRRAAPPPRPAPAAPPRSSSNAGHTTTVHPLATILREAIPRSTEE